MMGSSSSSCGCCVLLRLLPCSSPPPPLSYHAQHPHYSFAIATKLPSSLLTTSSSSAAATSSSSSSSSSGATSSSSSFSGATSSWSSSSSAAASASSKRQMQGRRELLGGLIAGVVAVQGSCAFLHGCKQAIAAEEEQEQAMAAEQEQEQAMVPEVGLMEGRLRGCNGAAPCVSTSAIQSPSRFMPPWIYLGNRDKAYNTLKKALVRMGAKIVTEDGSRYIYAFLPSANSRADVDNLEFLFVRNVLCYRSVSRVTIPDPPFCWWPGCINGPRNRGRLEHLRDELGWVPLETDEDKRWVPLLLH